MSRKYIEGETGESSSSSDDDQPISQLSIYRDLKRKRAAKSSKSEAEVIPERMDNNNNNNNDEGKPVKKKRKLSDMSMISNLCQNLELNDDDDNNLNDDNSNFNLNDDYKFNGSLGSNSNNSKWNNSNSNGSNSNGTNSNGTNSNDANDDDDDDDDDLTNLYVKHSKHKPLVAPAKTVKNIEKKQKKKVKKKKMKDPTNKQIKNGCVVVKRTEEKEQRNETLKYIKDDDKYNFHCNYCNSYYVFASKGDLKAHIKRKKHRENKKEWINNQKRQTQLSGVRNIGKLQDQTLDAFIYSSNGC